MNTGHSVVRSGHSSVNTGRSHVRSVHSSVNTGRSHVRSGHSSVNTGHSVVRSVHVPHTPATHGGVRWRGECMPPPGIPRHVVKRRTPSRLLPPPNPGTPRPATAPPDRGQGRSGTSAHMQPAYNPPPPLPSTPTTSIIERKWLICSVW